MDTDRLRGTVTYVTYRGLAGAIARAPEPVSDAVAAVLGTILGRRPGGSLELRERHIARVLASSSPAVAPDPGVVRRWALRSYRSYARYWVEGPRVPAVSREAIHAGMVIEPGYEHLKRAMAAGKGVVLALPHVGGWEWGGRFLAIDGMPMTVVAERVEPPELFEWFVELRREMTITAVALGEDSGRVVIKALRDGKLVGLLCDRDIAENGVEVEFFGERTTMPPGPATLALRTGAALLVASVYLAPRGQHVAVISAPIDTSRQGSLRQDVGRITQALAHRFEDHIRQAPEQWHMYQPLWPSDRAG